MKALQAVVPNYRRKEAVVETLNETSQNTIMTSKMALKKKLKARREMERSSSCAEKLTASSIISDRVRQYKAKAA